MTCSMSRDGAAYLLGALDPDERQRYEEHLERCGSCVRGVREMAGIPGLLARLTPDQVAAAEGAAEDPPPELLPRLQASVRHERRVRRWRLAVATGAAAACVGVVGAVVATHDDGHGTTATHRASGVTLQAVDGAPVHGTAWLTSRAWGTEIMMSCEYDGAYLTYGSTNYQLVVRDQQSHPHQLGSWKVTPGHEANTPAVTALDRNQISSIEVQTEDGQIVLHADL